MASLPTRTSHTTYIWQGRSWNGKDPPEVHWMPARSGCLADNRGVKTLFQYKGYGKIQEEMMGHLFPWSYSSRAPERGTFRRKKKWFIVTPGDMSFLCTLSSCPHLNAMTLFRISHKLVFLFGSSSSGYPLFGLISPLCSVFCCLWIWCRSGHWSGASQWDRQEASDDFVRYYGATRKVQRSALCSPAHVPCRWWWRGKQFE